MFERWTGHRLPIEIVIGPRHPSFPPSLLQLLVLASKSDEVAKSLEGWSDLWSIWRVGFPGSGHSVDLAGFQANKIVLNAFFIFLVYPDGSDTELTDGSLQVRFCIKSV